MSPRRRVLPKHGAGALPDGRLDQPQDFILQSRAMAPKTRNIADIHETNRKIILRTIWATRSISRADLVRATGINKTTVSAVVASLIEMGYVTESESNGKRVGRQPIELAIADGRLWFIAIDIRTYETIVAIVGFSGSELARETIRYPGGCPAPRGLAKRILAACARLASTVHVTHKNLGAIGVNVPGVVENQSGVVERCPCLGWKDVALAELLRSGLNEQIPVVIEPSAAAAIRAEIWYGRHLDEGATAVFVAVNEEIDTAMVLDGKILMLTPPRGPGSFGRMVVADHGPHSTTDERESWEDFASVAALVKRYAGAEAAASTERRALEIRAAAERREPRALQALDDEAYWLGVGIANIAVALGFQSILVGGILTELWEFLATRVESVVAERVTRYGTRVPRILPAENRYDGISAAVLTALSVVVPFDLLRELAWKDKQIIESVVLHHTPLRRPDSR